MTIRFYNSGPLCSSATVLESFTKMLTICAAAFAVFFGSVFHINAETFNCTQPPSFDHFDVNSCCRLPEMNLGRVGQKCQKYVQSLKTFNADFPPYTHICYPECIYRETGSLLNDEIHMENVKKFLRNNINRRDKEIVPQIISSFDTCLTNIGAHMKAVGITRYTKLSEGCSPYASMVFGCVNAETFLHCPANMWNKDRKCFLAKEFAEQCNPLPHVPLPII